MNKTTFAALATAVMAATTMAAPDAEAGKRFHGHGQGYSKHFKPHYGHGYGYRHFSHSNGYGTCAVWSYAGKYCVKWW